MSQQPQHDYLSVQEVAEVMNVSVAFVRRLVFEKRIPYQKFGKFVRITRADLNDYITNSRVESSS